jgi:hypothetical protein
MMATTRSPYAGYRFPAEIISHAVWLYFLFPLGLRMVEDLLAARGIIVSHDPSLPDMEGNHRCYRWRVSAVAFDLTVHHCGNSPPT